MPLLAHPFLAEHHFHRRVLASNHLNDLSDLPDQLPRVRHNDHLDFDHAHIDLHQRRYHKCTSLSTSIHGLECEISGRILHNLRDRERLNYRGLVVGKFGQASLDRLRHIQGLPGGFPRL